MVIDQWHLSRLPVVRVGYICVERVERVIAIVNTYSIIDSECGRVGSMVSEFKHAD